MKQIPVAIGLLTCEQVIIEEGSRNVTPVNCFTERFVPNLPSDPVPFTVFSILTNAFGEMELVVIIQRLDDFDEVFKIVKLYVFTDPLDEIRCMVRVRECRFPVEGQYQVTLLCDNEVIAQSKFRVTLKE